LFLNSGHKSSSLKIYSKITFSRKLSCISSIISHKSINITSPKKKAPSAI
jgi:hypothetical protein